MVDPSLNERGNRLDRLQLCALAGLMFLGAAFIYSATKNQSAWLPWYDEMWVRQVIWYVMGIGAGAVLCILDYHKLARWSLVIYWATILCLIAVLIPKIGSTNGWGARRWIDLPLFQFQPSEFAKLAFILAMANFLSRPPDELKQPAVFWKAIGLMLLPFFLILKEPDLGSALVLVPTGVVMMFVAGTPKRYLLKLGAGVGIVGRTVAGGHFVRAARAAIADAGLSTRSGCWFISARVLPMPTRRPSKRPRRAVCNLSAPIR